tara:strand:- start:6599 stop:7285 length:687 start_codon:yes stop_codon:yes gene_type:complete
MKSKIYLLNIFLFLLLSSFTKDRACEYVGSNIDFITSQTQKALLETDLNKAKFEIYKAINAIEKTKEKLEDCGCSYASKNLFDGLDNLIMATKTSTINGARFLLNRVLENTASSIEALKEHHTHQSKYQNDVLTLNTTKSNKETSAMKMLEVRELRQTIDASLVKFENSLDDIVKTVDCNEAKAFILDIYNKCEQALLKEKLSEGKKYYNLRTKAIASEALDKLKNCN